MNTGQFLNNESSKIYVGLLLFLLLGFVYISIATSPDLVITNANVDDCTWSGRGDDYVCNFSATVKNQGTSPANYFVVSLQIDANNDKSWDSYLSSRNIVNPLRAGDFINLKWVADLNKGTDLFFFRPGVHLVKICADAYNTVSESNETNNCSSLVFAFGTDGRVTTGSSFQQPTGSSQPVSPSYQTPTGSQTTTGSSSQQPTGSSQPVLPGTETPNGGSSSQLAVLNVNSNLDNVSIEAYTNLWPQVIRDSSSDGKTPYTIKKQNNINVWLGAKTPSGYVIDRWEGCDSVSQDQIFCNVKVNVGQTKTVTVYFFKGSALMVNSNVANVSIEAYTNLWPQVIRDSSSDGKTPYIIKKQNNINIWLGAKTPLGYVIDRWEGCDLVPQDKTFCNVQVNVGQTKKVTVYFHDLASCPSNQEIGPGYGAEQLDQYQQKIVYGLLLYHLQGRKDLADRFFSCVIPCESSWRANAEGRGVNCLAVGLFQLESKSNPTGGRCSEEHRFHPWWCQPKQAVDVYNRRGSAYWECWSCPRVDRY